jgi:PKD repeat protein
MNRHITQLKKGIKNFGKLFLFSAVAMTGFTFSASAQYATPSGHYYGTCWSNGTFSYNRYAAIKNVRIEDESGNDIYNKAGVGNQCQQINTAGSHYYLAEPTSAFTLSAGSNYTLYLTTENRLGTNGSSAGIWLDFSGNQNWGDAGDVFLRKTNFPINTEQAIPFTVPCSITAGDVRMRIRTDDRFTTWQQNQHTNGGLFTAPTYAYGETHDYTFTLATANGLSSNFFVADTAYVGTIVNFVNSNQSGYISHNWTINGVSSSSTNAEAIFTTPGTYTAKLVSTNCNGVDSTTKTVVIVAPTSVPVSNFVSDKNIVEIFVPINLIDLSTNGPTYWDWVLINGTDTIDGDDLPFLRGGDPYIHQNPTVSLDEGLYTVILTASNSVVGPTVTETKVGYITVQRSSYNMGTATVLPAGIITTASGTIYDKGGPNGNYTAPETNEALIAPCGAQSVTIDFTTFDVNANATMRIYDGVNALGTLIGTYTLGSEPTGPITANSGAMYLLWTTTAGATTTGFAANWSSVAGTGATPVADFVVPGDGSTLYNAVSVNFQNTSLNAEGSTEFEWTLAGPENGTYNTREFGYTFLSNGNYTLTLKVTTCDNQISTVSKSFTVVSPTTPTSLDFVASNQRPALGDATTLTATSDKANNWEWSIFPATGWALDGQPNTSNSREVTFSQPGAYTVQCRAYNSTNELASEATVVKTSYIIVVQHCTPIIGVTTSTDVSISYVSVEDPISGSKFENPSSTGVAYTDFSDLGALELNFGGTYNFEVKRASNVNPMSRKIWIDWNVDGDFDDAGELVATEATGTSMSWMGSIVVPNAATAFEANTRLRVGVSYNTDLNEPCGASSNPSANRVGEFEDYLIRVVNDGDAPVITLNGDNIVYVEQNASPAYMTAGATAIDPSQGDVSANLVMTTDLDQSLAGVYYEVWNAMDASGNAADPVTRVIYVVADQTAPVITINAAADTTIEVGTPWIDLGATALDNKEGDLTSAIVTTGMVDENLLGDYIITYSVQDNQGNGSNATRTVRVVDTQVPVIDNANADKSSACWTVEVQLQNIFADITTASDNYNGLGNGLTFTANPASPQGGAAVDTRFQGTTSVTYTATDESGNVTTQCVDYVVRDYIAPEIDLRTLDVINHRVNTPYVPVAATANDNLYSSTQISLTSSSNVDAYTLGTYQDTYTATDAAGNTSTKVRTVNVIDDVSPVVSGKNGGVIKVGVGSAINAIDFITFTDNYDAPADLLANHILVSNDINLMEAGLYSAVFKTEDNSGNVSNDFTLLLDVQYKYDVITNSVGDITLDNLMSVNPNPTSGNVNINVNLPENEEITLAIFNTMGQQVALVKNGKAENGTFNVSLANQANGIYYVKMNVQDKIVTKKIILNK